MEVTIKASARSETGKGVARAIRREGAVPAVLYGRQVPAQALSVEGRDLEQALRTEGGHNVLVNLKVGKDSHFTMLREIQRHPIRGSLLHVDFLAIDRDVKIETSVPVHLTGESRGVREGGVIEHHLWELVVLALPRDVPPAIEVDMTDIGLGGHVRVHDLVVSGDVQILTEGEEIIASVVEPQVIQLPEDLAAEEAAAEEAAAAEAEGAEPSPEAAAEEESS